MRFALKNDQFGGGELQGYIKLYRKLMDSPVWDDPNYLKLWMYCLMKATHKKREILVGNKVITLEQGQFVTGRNTLTEDLNKGMKPKQKLSEKTWYRYLENLEKWQMLTINKTNKYSIISICKWVEYQDSDQHLTNSCPSTDHQLTTNKNVKNVKEEEEEDALVYFDRNIARLSEHVKSRLLDWIKDFNEEIVLAAVKLAADNNATTYSYVNKILIEWHKNNLKDIDQVRNYEIKKKNKTVPFKPRKAAGEVDWENI